MKKTVSLILALTTAFSLCACGKSAADSATIQDATGNANLTDQSIPTAPPTAEEAALLRDYAYALQQLETLYDMDNDQLKEHYALIKTADVVDKYAGTKYAADYDISNWNRQSVLDRFVVIEDVMLDADFKNVDFVGNEKVYDDILAWNYNEVGQQNWIFYDYKWDYHKFPTYVWDVPFDPAEIFNPGDSVERDYDETGKLTQIRYLEYDDVLAKGTPEYDVEGRLVRLDMISSQGKQFDIRYAYNDRGQVTEIDTVFFSDVVYDRIGIRRIVYKYTYDADGKMICREYCMYDEDGTTSISVTREYTYNNEGLLVSAVEKEVYYGQLANYGATDQIQYVHDEKGRVKTITVSLGDELYLSVRGGEDQGKVGTVYTEAEYEKSIVEFVYGDYYIYNPAQ